MSPPSESLGDGNCHPATPLALTVVGGEHLTALADGITLGAIQPAEVPGAGLRTGSSTVSLASADVPRNGTVFETRFMEAPRVRSEAQPQARASSADNVFASADLWEERLALA